MDRRGDAKGYLVVLLGALTSLVGSFLPYYDYPPSGIESVSLYRLYTFGLGAPGISVGGVLVLFAGLATLVWVALAGVRGSSGDWTRPTLVAVSIAWSLTWIGSFLGASRFGAPVVVGYWVLVLSVGVVVIGTILVWVSARSDATKLEAPPTD